MMSEGLIVVRRPFEGMRGGTECLIWLKAQPGSDFPKTLLNELYAFSQPVGLGVREAFKRRREDLDSILDDGVDKASKDHNGRLNWDKSYYFDYVAGSRIKVTFYQQGIPVFDDDDGEETDPLFVEHRGKPAITSVEFEEMYGDGALENAIRLALAR